MATKDEKISALTNLLADGTLTVDECSCIVAMLDGRVVLRPATGKSAVATAYENYLMTTVASTFQNPASVRFPNFESYMVKQGTIQLDGCPTCCRYIETLVDASNARGATFREDILLGIDEDDQILWWAQRDRGCSSCSGADQWVKMSRAS